MSWDKNQLYLVTVPPQELLAANKWGNSEADHALHNLIDCLALDGLSLKDVDLVLDDRHCHSGPMTKVIIK